VRTRAVSKKKNKNERHQVRGFEQAIEDDFDALVDFVSGFHVRRVEVFVIHVLFVVMTFSRS
jgi:hypothetical protein